MQSVMSPSMSPFSASSSPPPSPQQLRMQQGQQMSPRPSIRSRNSQSAHASPSNSGSMGPPAAPSPAGPSAASAVASPRLKRPLSSDMLQSRASASSPTIAQAASTSASASTDCRSSPRIKRQSQTPVRQSPSLHRRTADSTLRTPQTHARDSPSAGQNPEEASLAPLSIQSPSKRAKPSLSTKKLVPKEYSLCSMNDLVVLISDMLNQLVAINNGIPLTPGGLTRFHSRAPPTITITDYLHRIALHTTLEPSTLLSMVYYIDLLSGNYAAFTISSLTVHRFLITAATVASKGLCDSFCTNTFYARVGGISLRELNVLELEFLNRVGWRIVPQPEVLREYYLRLVRRMGDGWGFEDAPESESSLEFLLDDSSGAVSTSLSGSEGSRGSQSKASFLSGSMPIAGPPDKDAAGEPSGTSSKEPG
ncbi:Cyclin-U2-1 [Orbilia brochopaga]|nr:Cyclin-U2-1 [Drechslerella brochopaga]